ncbi:hypothetical protein EZS27_020820 [termite gut metagenome]|uniref:Uncharacterized protein n=1 Tax=termite gut metagenome TaxID=433724 RepID=A0A5J4RBG1_9ZZZZ
MKTTFNTFLPLKKPSSVLPLSYSTLTVSLVEKNGLFPTTETFPLINKFLESTFSKGYGRTDEILKKRDKTLIEEWEGEYGYQALKEGEDYGGINTEGWVAIATGATAGTIGLIEGGLMLAMGINSALLAHAVTAAQAALTAFELGYTLVESVSITVEVLKNSEHILSETLTIAQNAYNIGNISALLSTNLVASVVGAIIGVFAIALTVISIVFTVLSLVHKHNYMQYKNGMYVSQLSSEIIRPKKTPNLSGQDKEIIGYYPSGEIILIDDGTKVKDSSNKTAEEIFKKQRKHRVVEEESEATTRSGDYHRYIDIDLDPNVPRPIDFIPFNQR